MARKGSPHGGFEGCSLEHSRQHLENCRILCGYSMCLVVALLPPVQPGIPAGRRPAGTHPGRAAMASLNLSCAPLPTLPAIATEGRVASMRPNASRSCPGSRLDARRQLGARADAPVHEQVLRRALQPLARLLPRANAAHGDLVARPFQAHRFYPLRMLVNNRATSTKNSSSAPARSWPRSRTGRRAPSHRPSRPRSRRARAARGLHP